ncbi:FAD:protein FMN transferase [Parachryseolinea silvisoli]|uniref:FAD:protein FMN transferase n=1 Tax=Parachryseolinea silvisoli TaxID=2873601 RepID=UPI002265CC0E|nr:FAD:protein FMN transferase [Parachryseolinea silvisoli]MCD9015920.1 FAD:protein FMN transferase [Parachryseolinea silvisoli]
MILAFVTHITLLWGAGPAQEPLRVEGRTMGTTYHITYFDKQQRNFQEPIDSLLRAVNQGINTYDPASAVSQFNKSARGIALQDPHLLAVLQQSLVTARHSGGAFDPTVMPLVNAWGFGPARSRVPDQVMVDSIRAFVGVEKIQLTTDSLLKTDPRVQLDFGGIGQGYGADVITAFLRAKGVRDLLVELGGEGMAQGKNINKRKAWQIGILDPNSTRDDQFFKVYVALKNRSFTTAGNYFNYREINGKKYSHTIDPKSGYPADLPLLAVSVFASDCTTADAWDTAFMVMGHEKTIEALKTLPGLDAILFYTAADGTVATYVTPGIRRAVTFQP